MPTINEVCWQFQFNKRLSLGLVQKGGLIGHVGIAILFDDAPTFSVDFGQDVNKLSQNSPSSGTSGTLHTDRRFSQSQAQQLSASLSSAASGNKATIFQTPPNASINRWADTNKVVSIFKEMQLVDKAAHKRSQELIEKLVRIGSATHSLLSSNCRNFADEVEELVTGETGDDALDEDRELFFFFVWLLVFVSTGSFLRIAPRQNDNCSSVGKNIINSDC